MANELSSGTATHWIVTRGAGLYLLFVAGRVRPAPLADQAAAQPRPLHPHRGIPRSPASAPHSARMAPDSGKKGGPSSPPTRALTQDGLRDARDWVRWSCESVSAKRCTKPSGPVYVNSCRGGEPYVPQRVTRASSCPTRGHPGWSSS